MVPVKFRSSDGLCLSSAAPLTLQYKLIACPESENGRQPVAAARAGGIFGPAPFACDGHSGHMCWRQKPWREHGQSHLFRGYSSLMP